MLCIIRDPEELPYGQLMAVYEQSNRLRGTLEFTNYDSSEQLLLAEQALYQYLADALRSHTAIVALWMVRGVAVSGLRLEKYQDGLLISGLETAPEQRSRGYAQALVSAVLKAFSTYRIYSHVYRDNPASLALHEKCGFRVTMDSAVLLDGNVTQTAVTYEFNSAAPGHG